MKIAVIALGKIGLPLAVQFAGKGHDVVGVDVNTQTVAEVNAGREPFPGEADLGTYLAAAVQAGSLRATTDYGDAVPGADAVVVVVPLFVDQSGLPDFGWMDAATRDVGRHLTAGTLVSYETTLPVGTTRNRWKPMLEAESGLVEGADFHVAFSPERVLTGRVFVDLRRYPKIVGGLGAEGTRRAIAFYTQVLDFDERPDLARPNGVWDLGSVEAAELTKLAETTYRDVNIGLANQFARFADAAGIDVYGVIEAANSQPYSHIHRSRSVATASRSIRSSISGPTPTPTSSAPPGEPTRRCPRTPCSGWRRRTAICVARRSWCSARRIAAASRRQRSPGSFRSSRRFSEPAPGRSSTIRSTRMTSCAVSASSRTDSASPPMPPSSRLIIRSTASCQQMIFPVSPSCSTVAVSSTNLGGRLRSS